MSKPKVTIKRVPISARAVRQRLNSKLAPDHKAVRKCSSDSPAWYTLGDYYLLNFQQNYVIDTHVNLESMARDFGVLAEWDEVAED